MQVSTIVIEYEGPKGQEAHVVTVVGEVDLDPKESEEEEDAKREVRPQVN